MSRNHYPALLVSLASAVVLAGPHSPARSATLQIPHEFASIQAAIDAAVSGDTLMIDGTESPYDESISIDTARLNDIVFTAMPNAPLPVLTGDETFNPIVTIDATAGDAATVRIEKLSIDGLGTRRYGILGNTADRNDDEVLLDLMLSSVAVQRCRIGVQVGTRTGTHRCDGHWGAVSELLLEQARSRVTMTGCAIVNCISDGANLYRVDGGIYDTLIGFNGDEGVHTTAARDFIVRHSIIVKNYNVGFHFQLGNNVLFENNVVLATLDPGYGLSLEGMQGDEALRVYNNIFSWQEASGLKVNPVVYRFADGSCVGVRIVADVRNNVFTYNGVGTVGDAAREDLYYRSVEVPYSQLFARFNLFEEGAGDASNVVLGGTNLFRADPDFTGAISADQLPDSAPEAFRAYAEAWGRLGGFGLGDLSEAIDAGEPTPEFEDEGGLARGSAMNDVGAFGGPGSDWGI
ncbi:MAG: hypothetical protein CME06_08220 [Gemmatimonadetes bacterium]|nr:hypothetical protein [Gemmatimonadota bacterium]